MNLSFSGCGFLCIYHVGVASCFREYAPHVLVDKIAGASGGSLAACALICSVPLGETTSDVLRIAVNARSRTLGPIHPGFDLNKILHEGLARMLPEDAHLRCNGRLHISVTRVRDFKNVLLSEFNSRDDLIQALLCSCFIPFYSGIVPPKFCGVPYIDGGFSDNLPNLDDHTITVSPFAGESDICPQDTSFNVMQFSMSNTSVSISTGNLYRFVSTLFPPHPETLSQICQQGFDDALKFLQRNNIISCTRCLAVQSSFGIAESRTQTDTREIVIDHPYDDCIDCRYRRQKALLDKLPESVVKAIEESIEQMNKGVLNWLFRHNPVKILPFIALPYVLPIDITIVVCAKIWETLPYIQREMKTSLSELFTFARNLITKFDKRNQHSANFSCQLAITEFDYANKERKYSAVSPVINSEQNSPPDNEDTTAKRQMRKRMSYAGCTNIPQQLPMRRKSMVETSSPERVVKNMKFDFTVDLSESNTASENRKKKKVMDAFQSLKENTDDTDVFDIANQVLDLEKDYIDYIEPQKTDFKQVIEVTKANEAVMAYYYQDGKKVKVTKIFNISDEDASIAMTDDEKELNSNLQWDSTWDMCSSSVSDYESTNDIEDDGDIFPGDYECPGPSTSNLETADAYSLDVHGNKLRRARKKSVVSKLPFPTMKKLPST